jgi:TRAP-type C4-dicarboxylate transport system permease small subunit
MVEKLIDAYCNFISYVIAAALAVMVVLVFGNVFMRYAFNSGFTVSEELSRWLFVWLTFLGAVVALRKNAHLGTDMLVGKLGPMGKKICMGISLLLMLYCLWLLFKGHHQLDFDQRSDGNLDELFLCIRYGICDFGCADFAGRPVATSHRPN